MSWSDLRSVLLRCEEAFLGWSLPPMEVALREMPIDDDEPRAWCLRCGQSVGFGEAGDRGCGSCRGVATSLSATVRLGSYGGPLARRILQVKHLGWHAMGEELGGRLARQAIRALPPDLTPEALIPVPMPWLRRWQRGIDHADLIARAAGRRLGLPVRQLLEQRNGAPQASRGRSERRAATGRFTVRRHALRWWRRRGPFRVVGLVDDVRTTGGTLEQCGRSLLALGVERVVALVLAVTPSPRRRGRPPTPGLPATGYEMRTLVLS